MTWEYPITLEKSTTKDIHVELVRHNAMLILTCRNTGERQRYMGYGIQEAKRQFKNHLKGIA
tara:strand:+ start:409 stop:594 length:186 start_codon:yes stop_codon:yes gene_type:complete